VRRSLDSRSCHRRGQGVRALVLSMGRVVLRWRCVDDREVCWGVRPFRSRRGVCPTLHCALSSSASESCKGGYACSQLATLHLSAAHRGEWWGAGWGRGCHAHGSGVEVLSEQQWYSGSSYVWVVNESSCEGRELVWWSRSGFEQGFEWMRVGWPGGPGSHPGLSDGAGGGVCRVWSLLVLGSYVLLRAWLSSGHRYRLWLLCGGLGGGGAGWGVWCLQARDRWAWVWGGVFLVALAGPGRSAGWWVWCLGSSCLVWPRRLCGV